MEVSWNVPHVFDAFKFNNLHNRLEASSSSYMVNANVSAGLTRLLGSLPEDVVTFHENLVTNILHDIGTRYVETWFQIRYIRNEAKRVKQEILDIDNLYGTSSQQNCKIKPSAKLEIRKLFQRSFSENKELVKEYFKYSWKRNAAVKKFLQSMKDTFEGSKYLERKKTTITIDKKLQEMREKFRKIVMLLNEEQLMLQKMLGQLRRDVTRNVALPELTSCHFQLEEAIEKLRRAETKWIEWKNNYDLQTRPYSRAISSAISILKPCALFFLPLGVLGVLGTFVQYYYNNEIGAFR